MYGQRQILADAPGIRLRGAQKRVGAEVGAEATLWENVRTRQRVVLELRGRGMPPSPAKPHTAR